MKHDLLTQKVHIPKGVSVQFQNYTIIVKGSKGELKRKLDTPRIHVAIAGEEMTFSSEKASKREKRMMNTYIAHVNNMFKGINEGHTYRLKICSGHFPMTVAYKNNILEVKNFLGEKIPRTLKVKPGVDVKIEGDIIVIHSIDKELAGLSAAAMEQLTRRPGFDRRIYQDGIYIIEKDSKKM